MASEKIPPTPELAGAVAQVQAHLRSLADDKAGVKFRASTHLERGLTTKARMRKFHMTIDEPKELGGADEGPNPVEIMLAAFGTCQEIVYGVYAAALGIRLDKLEIDVECDLDPRGFFGVKDVPPGPSAVRFKARIESPDSPERIAELVHMVETHCPVLDALVRTVPVGGSATLNGAPIAATGR